MNPVIFTRQAHHFIDGNIRAAKKIFLDKDAVPAPACDELYKFRPYVNMDYSSKAMLSSIFSVVLCSFLIYFSAIIRMQQSRSARSRTLILTANSCHN